MATCRLEASVTVFVLDSTYEKAEGAERRQDAQIRRRSSHFVRKAGSWSRIERDTILIVDFPSNSTV